MASWNWLKREKVRFKCFSKEAIEVLNEYLKFSRDTWKGKYGLTAQH